MKLVNSTNILVEDEPVLLLRENSRRKTANIWAGDADLYYGGDRYLEASGHGTLIKAGGNAEIKGITGEIWVRRAAFASAKCSFNEELAHG